MSRRERVFGPGRAVPLDRNAKARILVYAKAWGARHKQPRQHKGPITRAFLEVLEALLWGFHNARSGCCFPSYETIAARAECARSTVAEALKALEWAGVLTWQNRITRIHVRERDLFGHWASRWRVIRTSNAYVFRDPQPQPARRDRVQRSDCRPVTGHQDDLRFRTFIVEAPQNVITFVIVLGAQPDVTEYERPRFSMKQLKSLFCRIGLGNLPAVVAQDLSHITAD
jgi:hypothetical protein